MQSPLSRDGRVTDVATYERVTGLVPIACVDALPVQGRREERRLLLIRRDRPEGGDGWTLVGGGVYRGEDLGAGLSRHLRQTLGEDVRWEEPDYDRPAAVGQYFPVRRAGAGWDPRKHAIALTYVVALDGRARPAGEAKHVEWFAPAGFPSPSEFGFGQELVIARLLHSLGGKWSRLAADWDGTRCDTAPA